MRVLLYNICFFKKKVIVIILPAASYNVAETIKVFRQKGMCFAMFDKQVMKKLEAMLNQMSPAQKEKLSQIMKDEESLKNAISSIDPQKAQKVMETLGKDDTTAK